MRLAALLFTAACVATVPAIATPLGVDLALNPSSQVSGMPGQTIGWGFTLAATSTYYVVVDSFAFTPANLVPGTFTDFSAINFIDVGPGSPQTQLFSATNQTGVGSVRISLTASPGTTDGEITMIYDLYIGDPAGTGTLYESGLTDNVAASIVVNALPTPEPSTWGLVICAGLLLCWYRKRHA